jgi:ATP-dependent Zn protease
MSGTDASLSVNSPVTKQDAMSQQMQQQMMQQQMMQQQQMMKQQQMMQQQQQEIKNNPPSIDKSESSVPSSSDQSSNKKESTVVKVREEPRVEKSLFSGLTNFAVLFALFFIFSSSQVEGGLASISYLQNVPYTEYVNLLIRSLLFVIIYFIADKFIL